MKAREAHQGKLTILHTGRRKRRFLRKTRKCLKDFADRQKIYFVKYILTKQKG